ncbi:MAG: glutamine amidotransferase, partial [Spirochaetales bacterium]|nr:glutamine amidotransferase [Spirochaetales bacterium]
ADALDEYDVIILSDIGANTVLLHPDTWIHGKTVPNRLQLLADWVRAGGAVAMCGGYLSFSGIYGSARFAGTPIEQVLPVVIERYDDRVETPQGARVKVVKPDHPVVAAVPADWPVLLGYNEVTVRDEADLVAEIDGRPFIATMQPGKGRSLVWTSDIGPHWCPMPFITWSGYSTFWQQAIRWLAGR